MSKFINKFIFISLIFLLSIFSASYCLAGILDNWQDPKAYKPNPVLFLHGFAKGKPLDWDGTKAALATYFSKYQPLGPYLEAIDFQDPNGSVDRYPSGQFNPQGNSSGWSDKVNDKVNELLSYDKYGAYTNKFNFVCHSMGGLAARWYLGNYSNVFVNKLIFNRSSQSRFSLGRIG
jgi:triacylglycerol esterase/lipase EstA (alpha/beta hydrolase family)